jgi:hypothetical protein
MRVGVLPTGDVAVRAAHSLAAHPGIDSVVVIGPAQSTSFPVKPDARGCDILIGTGDRAPALAARHEIGLVWDGDRAVPGVAVWGASPEGLTIALMSETEEPTLVAVAHPAAGSGNGMLVSFPAPIGALETSSRDYDGIHLASARSENGYSVCYVRSATRALTIVDDSRFLSGVALAAGIGALDGEPGPVWESANRYLHTAIDMGLVMGGSG